MSSEIDGIDVLRQRGFPNDFSAEHDKLRCLQTNVFYEPEQCCILETQRFEGLTSLSDEAIVLAIVAPDGTRGILMDAYGPYASAEVAELVVRIPKKQNAFRQPAVDQARRTI